jgi:hypothetical protein
MLLVVDLFPSEHLLSFKLLELELLLFLLELLENLPVKFSSND